MSLGAATRQTRRMQSELSVSTPRKQPLEKPAIHGAFGRAHCLAPTPAPNARRREPCRRRARIGRRDRRNGAARKIRRRLAPMGGSHELAPYLDRQSAARDPFGWRVVVVAEPNPGHEL